MTRLITNRLKSVVQNNFKKWLHVISNTQVKQTSTLNVEKIIPINAMEDVQKKKCIMINSIKENIIIKYWSHDSVWQMSNLNGYIFAVQYNIKTKKKILGIMWLIWLTSECLNLVSPFLLFEFLSKITLCVLYIKMYFLLYKSFKNKAFFIQRVSRIRQLWNIILFCWLFPAIFILPLLIVNQFTMFFLQKNIILLLKKTIVINDPSLTKGSIFCLPLYNNNNNKIKTKIYYYFHVFNLEISVLLYSSFVFINTKNIYSFFFPYTFLIINYLLKMDPIPKTIEIPQS